MEITLSITEAGYIALIQAMCDIIPFMVLMKEISCIFDIHIPKTEVFSLNITKFVFPLLNLIIFHKEIYIAIKYHHFEIFV